MASIRAARGAAMGSIFGVMIASASCKAEPTPQTTAPSASSTAKVEVPTASAAAAPAPDPRAAAPRSTGAISGSSAHDGGATSKGGPAFGCESSGVQPFKGDPGPVLAAAGLKRAGSKVKNECGTELTPSMGSVNLGAPFGEAAVVTTEDCACYGVAGSRLVMLAPVNGKFVSIMNVPACGLHVKSTRHQGLPDIVPVTVPCVMTNSAGLNAPPLTWNGSSYDGSPGIRGAGVAPGAPSSSSAKPTASALRPSGVAPATGTAPANRTGVREATK